MDTIFPRPHILQWRKLIQILWQSNGRNRNRNKYAIATWKEAQSNQMIPSFVFFFGYTRRDRLPFRLICTEIKTQTDSNLADADSIYTRRFLCVLTSPENDKMLKRWDTKTGLPLKEYYRLHSRLTLSRLQTKRWRSFGFAVLLLSNVKVSKFTL